MNLRERFQWLVDSGLLWAWILDNVCYFLLGAFLGAWLL